MYKIKELADYFFSCYIKARDNYTCVVCGSKTLLQCGHLFSRVSNATRYDEDNAFCQCAKCNIIHEHDFYPLLKIAIDQFGLDTINKLHQKFKTKIKLTKEKLYEIAEFYRGAAVLIDPNLLHDKKFVNQSRRLENYEHKKDKISRKTISKKIQRKAQRKRKNKKSNMVCKKTNRKG